MDFRINPSIIGAFWWLIIELRRNLEKIEGSNSDEAKIEQTLQRIGLAINLIEYEVTQISEGNSKTAD